MSRFCVDHSTVLKYFVNVISLVDKYAVTILMYVHSEEFRMFPEISTFPLLHESGLDFIYKTL